MYLYFYTFGLSELITIKRSIRTQAVLKNTALGQTVSVHRVPSFKQTQTTLEAARLRQRSVASAVRGEEEESQETISETKKKYLQIPRTVSELQNIYKQI